MNKLQPWLKFGLIYAILMILFSLFTIHVYFIGIWTQSAISYLTLFVFFYLLAKKQKSLNSGFLNYGETFKFLFLMSFVGFVLLFLYNALYYNFINPDAIELLTQKAIESVESTMRSLGVPEDQVILAMEEAEKSQQNNFSVSNLFMSLAGTLIFTLILSAIAAIFLKKENKEL